MSHSKPVTEDDLHAYVDGELSPARQKEVEAHLDAHPEAAEEAEEYRRINLGLQQLHAPTLDEPLPEDFSQHVRRLKEPADTPASQETTAPAAAPRRPRLWLQAAAAVAWMTFGGLIGWLLQPAMVNQPVEIARHEDAIRPNLVQPAAFAHSVYTSEIRHPVEVGADKEQHLVTWLSKRLNTEIRAPNLAGHGYHLVGGRLLPSTNRMAAQFMYERKDGTRVTLYVRRGAWENETTAFRFEQKSNLGVFYWIDGEMGYALIAPLERRELQALSETVYEALL
jgi:anti-sigma factor RsiW